MFKANDTITIIQVEKRGMAVKTVDRTFLQGQSVDLFRAAIKSQATRDPYERRLIGFLKRMSLAVRWNISTSTKRRTITSY
jgi:hypothetical protein